ncbi:hypothetical protein SISNIDRAFT_453899 [Sistotremastrum niveocremeum HHB9708]|uniref:MYND-type domain-containing protein n=1 Tax=Sistotremastrum niveocremeum HHB9708 TaxID=1314777 RepID=A0A164VHW5_9AGAM|nr:hypothetical protein SISNIDRAFT_453899 [Sistotremastrum niveocremeum HHB9708]
MVKKSLEKELSESSSWEETADIICRRNGIDLSNRYGFKQVHKNFDATMSRLNAYWDKYQENEQVLGGIVIVFGRLAGDMLLRNQLDDYGFLSKILVAAKNPRIRSTALQTLHMITHQGGREMKNEIAINYTPILVQVLEDPKENEDDEDLESCISILSHTLTAIFFVDVHELEGGSLETTRRFQVTKILRLLLRRIRAKGLEMSWTELTHAVSLIISIPYHAREAYSQNPEAANLIVACLRSKSLSFRCQGMVGLYRHVAQLDLETEELDISPLVIKRANGQSIPRSIRDALTSYGFERCEIRSMMLVEGATEEANAQYYRDHDLAKLGRALAKHILTAEVTLPTGCCCNHGHHKHDQVPFSYSVTKLTDCARALREQDDPDTADILELQYYVLKHNSDALDRVGQAAIARNPSVAFFYYAMMMKNDSQVVHWAKKGLNCKVIAPYLRWAFLFHGARHAQEIAVSALSKDYMEGPDWDRGVAYLNSAYEDFKAFIEGAPPDSKRMLSALNRFTLLSIIMKGPELSTDLREISDILQKQKLAEETYQFYWGKAVPQSQVNCVRAFIIENLATAASQWRLFIKRTAAKTPDDSEFQDETLVEESVVTRLHELDLGPHRRYEAVVYSGMNDKLVKLYCCSWCGNTTATLKKCSRCGTTRYCDAKCQKMGWSEHKSACKSPEVAV